MAGRKILALLMVVRIHLREFYREEMVSILEKFKNYSHEQKMFFIFILVNLIVWPLVGMIRLVLPTDSLEGIFWGSLHDFGTPKHPPLAGWLTYLVYTIFKSDVSIYALSTVFVVTGFTYIYKLGKFFLDDKKALLSAIILEGCWAYTYVISYYGFNPDVILLGLLPIITYYAYKALHEDKNCNWLILGVLVGICFLNKYQTALVVVPIIIWALAFKREVFKNVFVYISILIAFLIFLPHLLWLIKYDFFPLLYFEGELAPSGLIARIATILNFLLLQVAAILGTVVIFLLLKWKQKSKIELKFQLNPDDWFLLLVGFMPLIIHLLMGTLCGGTMRPRWGYEFLFLSGIILFYFIPTKEISKDDFNFVLKLSYTAMALVAIVMLTLLGVEKNYRSRYPVTTIYNDMMSAWNSKIDTPLKYVGGYIEWTLPLTIYAPTHPTCILDTGGYKNPWIDEEDLKKSGLIIIDRKIDEIKIDFLKSCPYLGKDYPLDIKEYRFKVKNALNMEREYQIYYLIVPPEK